MSRQRRFLASWRKIGKQSVLLCAKNVCHDIEQSGVISWNTLSPQVRRGYIFSTVEKQGPSFYWASSCNDFFGIVESYCFFIFFSSRGTVNAEHYCQLLDKVKLANWQKRQKFLFDVWFCSMTTRGHSKAAKLMVDWKFMLLWRYRRVLIVLTS